MKTQAEHLARLRECPPLSRAIGQSIRLVAEPLPDYIARTALAPASGHFAVVIEYGWARFYQPVARRVTVEAVFALVAAAGLEWFEDRDSAVLWAKTTLTHIRRSQAS